MSNIREAIITLTQREDADETVLIAQLRALSANFRINVFVPEVEFKNLPIELIRSADCVRTEVRMVKNRVEKIRPISHAMPYGMHIHEGQPVESKGDSSGTADELWEKLGGASKITSE